VKNLAHYIVTLFKVDNNTAAALTITVTTFILGIIATISINSFVKYLNRRAYRKSLKLVIKEFIICSRKQYKEFGRFSQQADLLHGGDYTIPIVANLPKNYLTSLELHTFVDNFASVYIRKRAKCISTLFKIVAMVELDSAIFKENQKLLFERYTQHEALYQKNLDDLRKYHDDLALQFTGRQVDPETINILTVIHGTFNRWVESGKKTEFIYTRKQVVDPIYNFCVANNHPHPLTQPALELCLRCRLAYENITKIQAMMVALVGESLRINKGAYKLGMLVLKNF